MPGVSPTSWGYGTTLGYGVAGQVHGGTFVLLANIIEIDDKKLKRHKMNTTTLTSPGNTETCRAGMVQPEAFKFKVQYNRTDHSTLLAIMNSAAPNHAFSITLSDVSDITGDGYISEFPESPKAVTTEIYENEISIQPVGPWVFTPGP